MSRSLFAADHFNDEAAAFAYVEARLWAHGRSCPHCGVVDRSGALKGKTNRIGLYKCYACRKPFTVKVGTIFEDSHIAMRDWLVAIHLIGSSKKGISSNQLHRTLGITLKSAWFLSHRIREAMTAGNLPPMGGEGAVIEIDETFIGTKEGAIAKRGHAHKRAVMTLVERGKGSRSFHVSGTASAILLPIIKANVSSASAVMTDDATYYRNLGQHFASHDFTQHALGEYVRAGEPFKIHSNTVEGFYSVFKRGFKGIYQHCGERHLYRYIAEYDFRYSNRVKLGINDTQRADRLLAGVVGKRLTYRTTSGQT